MPGDDNRHFGSAAEPNAHSLRDAPKFFPSARGRAGSVAGRESGPRYARRFRQRRHFLALDSTCLDVSHRNFGRASETVGGARSITRRAALRKGALRAGWGLIRSRPFNHSTEASRDSLRSQRGFCVRASSGRVNPRDYRAARAPEPRVCAQLMDLEKCAKTNSIGLSPCH
jgi:hypothetical protein